ncbi:hypothetical protein KR009_008324, partial [Drosophila setifemur]
IQFYHLWVFIVLIEVSPVRSYGQRVCQVSTQVSYLHPVLKTRQIPYQQHSFWRGWETKYKTTNYWENEIAYRFVPRRACCPGYEGSIYDCQPVCSEGCPGNRLCSAPGTCDCTEGYGGTDCQPLCPQGCGRNEVCGHPNQCICQEGFQVVSGMDGCQPQCIEGCGENSFCSEPGKCACLPGYAKSKDNTSCQAVCETPCGPNSHCQDPNKCACYEGYQPNSGGHCTPICQEGCGSHSECARPGVCECEAGYSLEGLECRPVCSQGCPDHGECLRPDVCICQPGYTMKADRCEPSCRTPCSDYARCVAPDKCQCYPGYESSGSGDQCRPKCSKGCPNGFCFSPETCVCDIGHLMGPGHTCEPQCSLNCVHGQCTQPETCSCEAGYRFKNGSQHVCEAICQNGCTNGDCVAPDICLCHMGFQPEGSNPATSVCQPVCRTACVNGRCSAPDECSCLEGYTKETDSTCKPLCSQGCAFGNCLSTIQLPTAAESVTSSADFLMLHHSNCSSDCLCWIEFDEEGILSNSKCAKICADDQDKPCRNLSLCSCHLPSGQMICNDSEDEDSSTEETRYVCKVPKPKEVIVAVKELTVSIQEKTSAPAWLILMATCAGIIVLAAVAVLVIKKLKYRVSRR